jgi:glycosyltransferase involved in cell wall biosynthesis
MVNVAHITTIDLSLRYLLLNQMKYLWEKGFQVIGISSPGTHTSEIESAGIQHIPIAITRRLISPVADLVSLVSLVRVLKKERFQIVHVHTPKASFLGQIAARLAGVPIVIRTLHGFYFHEGTPPMTRRAMIWMERFAGQFADAILSQNKEDIQTAITEKICKPEKISYLGNGIDLQQFNPAKINLSDLDQLRREFDLNPTKKVVGFVGRLVAEKGILELLQAVKIIQKKSDDIQFLFVGPIDRENKNLITPELAVKMGISEICKFVGFQEDMPLVYALMDVFVFPSHREGFPRSLMEASAMGLPVIATNIRGCREVVVSGENGLLVPLEDIQALSNSIMEILNNPQKASMMGKTGRKIAAERFDERKIFEKVDRAYQKLMNLKVLLNE